RLPRYCKSNGMFLCIKCRRAYKTKGSLMRHVKFECSKQKCFCCTMCDKKFTRNTTLMGHIVRMHPSS
ncbi:hypothetical protein ILUMI_15341, partial [Ignelater luminosus]